MDTVAKEQELEDAVGMRVGSPAGLRKKTGTVPTEPHMKKLHQALSQEAQMSLQFSPRFQKH